MVDIARDPPSGPKSRSKLRVVKRTVRLTTDKQQELPYSIIYYYVRVGTCSTTQYYTHVRTSLQKVDGDPNAANATDRVDTVVIETEILFGGVAGEQPPKDEVDNYMAANKKDLGVEEFGLSRGTSFIFSNLRDANGLPQLSNL